MAGRHYPRDMHRLLPILLVLVALPQAQAQRMVTLTCKGEIISRDVAANLIVPAGARCFLNDASISGSMQVQRGGILTVRNSNVQGRMVAASGFRRLTVQGSIVGGDLRAEGGASFNLSNSQVLGHVRLSRNTGPVRLDHVTLNRNLECWNNKTAPTGSWIRVDGRQLGQCSRL